ncbi:MAG: hypothetical protein AB7V18_19335 [Pyrinomonadaceae bacterium]
MSRSAPKVKRTGIKPIGSLSTRVISGNLSKRFMLAEHLDDRVSATVAQIEYQCEGHYCHVEVVDKANVYYVWLGPTGRKIMPRTLDGEKVKRTKGNVPRVRSSSKER